MEDCFRHNFDPKKTIMVGDRLNTDIQFGKEGGLSTLLVLTGNNTSLILWRCVTQICVVFLGISREEDLAPERSPPAIPDYITNSIGDLRQGNLN